LALQLAAAAFKGVRDNGPFLLAPHLQFPLHQRRDLRRSGKTIKYLAQSNKPRAADYATNGVDTAAGLSPLAAAAFKGVRDECPPLRSHPTYFKKKNHCSNKLKKPRAVSPGLTFDAWRKELSRTHASQNKLIKF
jgi:hypothetical protein